MLSVEHQGRRYYGRYQFDASMEPLPLIKEILGALGDADPWRVAAWFHYPSPWLVERDAQGLRNIAPKDVLDRSVDVIQAARQRLPRYGS